MRHFSDSIRMFKTTNRKKYKNQICIYFPKKSSIENLLSIQFWWGIQRINDLIDQNPNIEIFQTLKPEEFWIWLNTITHTERCSIFSIGKERGASQGRRKEYNQGGRQVGRWWVVGKPKTNTSTVGASSCILQNISILQW